MKRDPKPQQRIYTHKKNAELKGEEERRKRSQTKTSSQHSAQCNNNSETGLYLALVITHYSLYMFMTIFSCVGRVATYYSLFIAFQFGAFTTALQSFQ